MPAIRRLRRTDAPVSLSIEKRFVALKPEVSAGVAMHGEEDRFTGRLKQADTALHHAKRDGHGSFRVYTPGMAMPARNPHRRRAGRDAPAARTDRA